MGVVMHNILVSAMAYDGGKSGISEYIERVVGELSAENRIHLLILKSDKKLFPVRNENITYITYPDTLSKPLINMFWHLFILPYTIPYDDYDFVFLPAGNRRLFCRYPKYTIATFHDLSQYHVPGKYDIFRTLYIKRIIPYFIRKANHITNVSQSTYNDVVKYYKIPKSIMSVNYNGFDSETYNNEIKIDEKNLRDKYSIKKRYILYISRIEHPGKNHLNLIKAYEKLSAEIKSNYDLLLGGSFWQGSEPVKDYAEKSGDKDKIHFLGFVPDKILPALYKCASLYVFPSFFEGFGIPLIEAMACGTPAVCSNCSSLPEIGGEAVLTFNPNSPEEIASETERVLSDRALQKNMIKKGLKQVGKFSWRKHAERIIDIYERQKKRNK